MWPSCEAAFYSRDSACFRPGLIANSASPCEVFDFTRLSRSKMREDSVGCQRPREAESSARYDAELMIRALSLDDGLASTAGSRFLLNPAKFFRLRGATVETMNVGSAASKPVGST